MPVSPSATQTALREGRGEQVSTSGSIGRGHVQHVRMCTCMCVRCWPPVSLTGVPAVVVHALLGALVVDQGSPAGGGEGVALKGQVQAGRAGRAAGGRTWRRRHLGGGKGVKPDGRRRWPHTILDIAQNLWREASGPSGHRRRHPGPAPPGGGAGAHGTPTMHLLGEGRCRRKRQQGEQTQGAHSVFGRGVQRSGTRAEHRPGYS